jgi:hypothetical protein
MKRVWCWSVSVVVATAGLAMVLVPAAAANGQHGGHGPRFAVVADDLNNPRQLAVHDGAVYVAEAGTGGTNCVAAQPCVGFTGSVTRVRDHNVQRVQSGLLSVASVENGQTDVTGVDAVAFRGDQLYGVATGTCMPLPPLPEPLASQVAAQLGKVLRLNGGTSVTSVGDPGNFECTTVPDPDGAGRDTNPYVWRFAARRSSSPTRPVTTSSRCAMVRPRC